MAAVRTQPPACLPRRRLRPFCTMRPMFRSHTSLPPFFPAPIHVVPCTFPPPRLCSRDGQDRHPPVPRAPPAAPHLHPGRGAAADRPPACLLLALALPFFTPPCILCSLHLVVSKPLKRNILKPAHNLSTSLPSCLAAPCRTCASRACPTPCATSCRSGAWGAWPSTWWHPSRRAWSESSR